MEILDLSFPNSWQDHEAHPWRKVTLDETDSERVGGPQSVDRTDPPSANGPRRYVTATSIRDVGHRHKRSSPMPSRSPCGVGGRVGLGKSGNGKSTSTGTAFSATKCQYSENPDSAMLEVHAVIQELGEVSELFA